MTTEGRPTAEGRPSGWSSLLRFLAVGGSNTVITLVLFAILARALAPWLAYTVVFALGLSYTTMLTGRFVFGSDNTRSRIGLFVGWYLMVFVIGQGVVQTVQVAGVDSPDILALLTVVVTAPLSFLGGRWIFRARSPHSERELVP